MRKLQLFLGLALVLGLLVALPVAAASWVDRITGGGQATAGGTGFSVTVSAWKDADGMAAGNIEYSRPGVIFHAKVMCMGVFEGGRAVAAGPGWNQEGTWLPDGNWVIVNVLEGGVGAGDKVRVYNGTPDAATDACETLPSSFPGTVYDGNFNIRSK